jgi:hypothetical protein
MALDTFPLGKDAKLYRNTGSYGTPTWNECDNVKDLSLTLTKAEYDATRRASGGWRETIGTIKDIEVSFNAVYSPTDADITAFKTAYLNNATIEIWVLSGVRTDAEAEGPRMTCHVVEMSREEQLEGGQELTIKLKPAPNANAAPAWTNGAP